VKGTTIAARALEENGTHYGFPEQDRIVNIELKEIGLQLTHQLDPDLPTTKFSAYLIELESKDSSSRKNQGHEMRGVFLTILFYHVLSDSAKKLAYTMRPMTLSKYVKIFELTILVETFLNKPKYTVEELDTVGVVIKGYIFDFCNCVDYQEKEDIKLIKIHLQVHFVECIQMHGS